MRPSEIRDKADDSVAVNCYPYVINYNDEPEWEFPCKRKSSRFPSCIDSCRARSQPILNNQLITAPLTVFLNQLLHTSVTTRRCPACLRHGRKMSFRKLQHSQLRLSDCCTPSFGFLTFR